MNTNLALKIASRFGAYGDEAFFAPIWDRVLLPATDQPVQVAHTFFEKAMGTTHLPDNRCKTLEDTSMHLPGMFPKGNQFLATGFQVYFMPLNGIGTQERKTTVHILSRGVMTFTVGNRIYAQIAPLAVLAPSFPMYAAYDDQALRRLLLAGPSIEPGTQLKRESPRGWEITPVLIPEMQTFLVQIDFESLHVRTPGHLGVIIDGFLYRQVQ